MADVLEEQEFYFLVDDFLGGMQSYYPPNKTANNAVAQAKNSFVLENGSIIRRGGIKIVTSVTEAGNAGNIRTGKMIVAGNGTQRKIYFNYAVIDLGLPVFLKSWDGTTLHSNTFAGNTSSDQLDSDAIWVREFSGTEYIYWLYPTEVDSVRKATITNFGTAPTISQFADANGSPPVAVKFMASLLDRIWMATGNNSNANRGTVFFTKTLEPETWDRSVNTLSIDTDTGEGITALAAYRQNMLVIGKELSIDVVVVGTANIELDVERLIVSRDIGIASDKSMANVGEDLIFLDQYGQVRSLQQTVSDTNAGVVSLPISVPVKDIFDDMTKTLVERYNGVYFQGRYWISFQRTSGTWITMVYDPSIRVWTGPFEFKDGAGNILQVVSFAASAFSPNAGISARAQKLYMLCLNTSGSDQVISVYEYDATTTNDTDNLTTDPIDFDIQSKGYDFGFPQQEKSLKWIEVEYRVKSGTSGIMSVSARSDFALTWIPVGVIDYTQGNTIARKKLSLRHVPRGTYLQFRFQSSDLNTQPEIVRFWVSGHAHEVRNN